MPLDALTLAAVVTELKQSIVGARIDKIHQPGRDEIVLSLRAKQENQHCNSKLILSGNPQHPRAHLTTISRENPQTAPMFCMLLRKHLTGARILDISQPPMERMMEFHLETLDELGYRSSHRLILEAMGRHSNLILVDQENRIVDSLRRVDMDMSVQRQVLAGLFYHLPPSQGKENLSEHSIDSIQSLMTSGLIWKWILSTFGGLSPLLCREIAVVVCGSVDGLIEDCNRETLATALLEMVNTPPSPTLLLKEGVPFDFSLRNISQYENLVEIETKPSFSELLDVFYIERERDNRMRQKGQNLIRTVNSARDRIAKKIGYQKQELSSTENRDRLREFGDIITANLHAMSQGMTCLRAVDFYDQSQAEIEIPLDPLRSPQKNAAKYYKDYNKAKKANEMLQILIEKGINELDYLDSVLENMRFLQSEQDLSELRNELEDTGYLRKQHDKKKPVKRIVGKPMQFRSAGGLLISVGRNNLQNDQLTTKMAHKSDIWFHTQKIHGSHVILWSEGNPPDLASVEQAAGLAAWFSQGRDSGKVAVDYTPVKYVKKPNGARPGMVIYTTYETAMVAPLNPLSLEK